MIYANVATERPCRRAEAGYALLTVMIGICIVSVALISHAMLAGTSALVARGARNQLACRQAALALLNSDVPSSDGGSVPPTSAVAGWHDQVFVVPKSGEISSAGGALPEDAVFVDRQWRKGPDADGKTVFEVTATAVSADGRPLERWVAARVTFSRRAR